MKYYIYAPEYNENSGGSVVLHRLCHLINAIDGCEAYLVPLVPEKLSIVNVRACFFNMLSIAKWIIMGRFIKRTYKTNRNWCTPVLTKFFVRDHERSVVIYPETTYGNPLNAKNVVRWFLHQPGYFTKEVCVGLNELYYKFNAGIQDFNYCFSTLSKHELKVIYYPLEHYNLNGVGDKKVGCCHLIRKGKGKATVHPESSISIDDMTHEQVAEIFKKSARFISYDDYTAYSLFAVLCGCESIVVPTEGVTKDQWYPDPADRYGLAYGFSQEELEWARQTKNKVLEHILSEHRRSSKNVEIFVKETHNHFTLK